MMKDESELILKNVIKRLIKAGTTFNIEELNHIYHKDLNVIMINKNGDKTISNKEDFKRLFQVKKDNNDQPLNTWVRFNHFSTNDNKGHAILTRKVNLTGKEEKIVLSIDFIKTNTNWQVIREVIFM